MQPQPALPTLARIVAATGLVLEVTPRQPQQLVLTGPVGRLAPLPG